MDHIEVGSGGLQRRDPTRGCGAGGVLVGERIRQEGIVTVLCYPLAQTVEGVVGVALGGAAIGDGGHTVFIVIGVFRSVFHTVDRLNQLGQVAACIILITHRMAEIAAVFHVLHQPVRQVVVVGGLAAGFGICHGSQGAGVVILVGYGAAILKGFGQDTSAVVALTNDLFLAGKSGEGNPQAFGSCNNPIHAH